MSYNKENFNYGKFANEIHEHSKLDNAMIVGSEIRQAIHEAFEAGQRQGVKRAAEVSYGYSCCGKMIAEAINRGDKPWKG